MIRVHDGGKAAVRMEVYKDRWSALANGKRDCKMYTFSTQAECILGSVMIEANTNCDLPAMRTRD